MKALIALMIVLVLLAPPPVTAHAEGENYAVAVEDVWFYESASEDSGLFLLPDTYYVRVLERGEPFSTVEYLTDDAPFRKILGYCKTEQLTFVSFVPERPYLRREITVTYRLPGTGDLGTEEFTEVERTFVYYGDRYESGQLYLYVLDGRDFGYIPADRPPEYDKNDDYLADVTAETQPLPEQPTGPDAVQIVVILLACLIAVAVAVILLRNKRPPRHDPDF